MRIFPAYAAALPLLLALVGCSQDRSSSALETPPEALDCSSLTNEVEADACAFMVSYAHELRAQDGDALAARYRRSGAYRMGHGRKMFAPYDSIRSHYATQWEGPTYFAWRDLSFEALGPDAVLIAGQFDWRTGASQEPLVYSYSAVLTREDGDLRLLLEDESTSH